MEGEGGPEYGGSFMLYESFGSGVFTTRTTVPQRFAMIARRPCPQGSRLSCTGSRACGLTSLPIVQGGLGTFCCNLRWKRDQLLCNQKVLSPNFAQNPMISAKTRATVVSPPERRRLRSASIARIKRYTSNIRTRPSYVNCRW